jgi:uncharacterized membrane protein YidH (DUF202 family)
MDNNNVLENHLSIEEKIANDNERIICKKSFSSMSLIASTLGICLLVLTLTDIIPSGTISLVTGSIAIFLIIFGAIKLLAKETKFLEQTTKAELKKSTIYFDNDEMDKVIQLYKNKNFEELSQLKRVKDSRIVMYSYGTEEGSLYYTQLMKYVPYEFIDVQEMGIHTSKEEISALKNFETV